MKGDLDLLVTDGVRRRIEGFLGGITGYVPTLSLMKGTTSDDRTERWMFGAYGPENLRALEPPLRELGKPLLYSFDGVTAAIPQYQYVAELEGKTLAEGERGLIVVERSHDG